MTTELFPSVNDVFGGKTLTERNLTYPGSPDANWATYGMGLSAIDTLPANTTVFVDAGEAVVGGHVIRIDGSLPPQWPGAGQFGGTGARTRYVHLKVTCDIDGNVSAVDFTEEAEVRWMTQSSPTIYWLCLGAVVINSSNQITELVNSAHFPPMGQTFIGHKWGSTASTATIAANGKYEVTPEGSNIGKFLIPRPTLCRIQGVVCVRNSVASILYGHVLDGSSSGTQMAGSVAYQVGGQWCALPLDGLVQYMPSIRQPKLFVQSSQAGTLTFSTTTSYARFGVFLCNQPGM